MTLGCISDGQEAEDREVVEPLCGAERKQSPNLEYKPEKAIQFKFNSIQFYLYSAKLQQMSSQST